MTKLFLRSTQANGIGATYYDMLATAGSSSDTAVVDTVASGTEIQLTKTAGGALVQWISGRAPAGGFTLTTTDISFWSRESHMNANCGVRYRVFKRTAAGTETELGGGPFDEGSELGTTNSEAIFTGNVTDTAFAEDDRILLKVYITNVGTMGGGFTCTFTWDAADGSTFDSFFNIAETVTFKAEDAVGVLSGSSAPTFSTTGALTGNGALAGATTPAFTTAANLTADGPMAGASSWAFSPSANLTGDGALAGASSPTFSTSGTATANGALTGVSSPAFTTQAALVGDGALAGSISPAFTLSGTLFLPGAIQGSANVVFAPSASLTADGALAGLVSSAFVLSGTLSASMVPVANDIKGRLRRLRSRRRGIEVFKALEGPWVDMPKKRKSVPPGSSTSFDSDDDDDAVILSGIQKFLEVAA